MYLESKKLLFMPSRSNFGTAARSRRSFDRSRKVSSAAAHPASYCQVPIAVVVAAEPIAVAVVAVVAVAAVAVAVVVGFRKAARLDPAAVGRIAAAVAGSHLVEAVGNHSGSGESVVADAKSPQLLLAYVAAVAADNLRYRVEQHSLRLRGTDRCFPAGNHQVASVPRVWV